MRTREYQKFVKDGASPKYNKSLAVIALCEEVGEVAGVIKKEAIYEDMSKFEEKYGMSVKEKIADECGDILWQFVNLLNQYNISLSELMELNYNKLINRHNGNKVEKDGGKR